MTKAKWNTVLSACGALWLSACGLDSSGGGSAGTAGVSGAGGAGVGGDLSTCAATSDCVVAPESCCGSCGAATRGDAVATRRDAVGEHQAQACGMDFGCPACFMEPDPTLLATCASGRCQVVDTQAESSLTSCMDAAECRLRMAGCCECGDILQGQVIAIRTDAEEGYRELTCDPDTACDACLPNLEDSFVAACLDNVCRALPLRDF